MTTQFSRFSSGGFVIHHRTAQERWSAWYDAAGNVLDFESFRVGSGYAKRSNESERRNAMNLGQLYKGAK